MHCFAIYGYDFLLKKERAKVLICYPRSAGQQTNLYNILSCDDCSVPTAVFFTYLPRLSLFALKYNELI